MSDWADERAAHIYAVMATGEEHRAIDLLAVVLRETHQTGVLEGIDRCQRIAKETFAKVAEKAG